jgi:hypothetical protein
MSKALYINADKNISYFYKFPHIKQFICTTIYCRNDTEFIKDLMELYNSHNFKYDNVEFNNGINILYFWKNNRIVYYYLDFDIFNYNDELYNKILIGVDIFIFSSFTPIKERHEYIKRFVLPIDCIEYNINSKCKLYTIVKIEK